MSYVVKVRKPFAQSAPAITQHAVAAIELLGGKSGKKNNPADGQLDVNFNKKIGSKPIDNRIQLEVTVQPQEIGNCLVAVIGYPVDPLGNKLSFGVNGDPARVVVDAFFDELTRRLVA